MRKATGRGWEEWIGLLKAAGAADWSHKEIVAWLAANSNISGWWRQTVAVRFEQATGRRAPGQTADAKFQIGVRITVAATPEAVWEALVSPAGKALWLASKDAVLAPKTSYEAADGTRGEIRVVKPADRVRFTRRDPDASTPSTVQITLAPSGEAKTTVTFHHEKLRDTHEREAMRRQWKAVADRIKAMIEG